MLIIIFGRKHIVKAGFSVINILVYQTEMCVFLQEWVTLLSEAEWIIKNTKGLEINLNCQQNCI